MLWIGLILVVAALVLFFFATRSKKKAYFIQATETSKIGDVQRLVDEVKADMIDGMSSGYRDYIEVKGQIVADQPLAGELSEGRFAICQTTVSRIVERLETNRDSQGNVRQTWRKSTERLTQNRRDTPFWIDDGTGRIRVKAGTKGVDLVKVVDRFEPPSSFEGGLGSRLQVSLGGFSLGIGGMGSQSRTVGYQLVEEVLPVGQRVYALGEVADTEDEGVVLRTPTDEQKDRPFMLSTKTEEELLQKSAKSQTILRVIGAVVGVGGLALVVLGILR
ncbi:MAG: E3 ubiquitin ligase family protein [Myxococcales bacterium]|nr:E3 ubiquitin ligase family protein [Myxococcales bacterium]MCB9736417.1 hypothetical protein [Deltaproteobacteria bacterium]